MEAAFERLPAIQQKNINRQMFAIAYSCVVRSRGDTDVLVQIVQNEARDFSHLEADLMRYCKLVRRVM